MADFRLSAAQGSAIIQRFRSRQDKQNSSDRTATNSTEVLPQPSDTQVMERTPVCLLDFPNEALLAVIARVEFSTENFTKLSLVSKHFRNLMKTHKTQILNEVAEVQFLAAEVLRQDNHDHSVSSIFDLYYTTYHINSVVSKILQNQWTAHSLLQHHGSAEILTAAFHTFHALRMLQMDPRLEGDSALFLLSLGPQAVASMYYASTLLCVCLIRKAVEFRHQRWLRILSHPAAVATLQTLLIYPGIAFFFGLVTDDDLWSESGGSETPTEPLCDHDTVLGSGGDMIVNFGSLVAHHCGICSSCSAQQVIDSVNLAEEEMLDLANENLPHWHLRVAESYLEHLRDPPNFLTRLLTHRLPSSREVVESTLGPFWAGRVRWGSVIHAELLWQSLDVADLEHDLSGFLGNVAKAVDEVDRMDPEATKKRRELVKHLKLAHPMVYAIIHSGSIDWAWYVSNKIYQCDFEMWAASTPAFVNVQDAAVRISTAAKLWKAIKYIVEERNITEEEPEPYRVFLRVHELCPRAGIEELQGAIK